ncbi:uncharacterized protein [Montipora capricornis]|uniref:uncharacterized protein n=1 Tax=Montipora capricornis TaxID=246305 RepID=UPI0035F21243
MTELVKAKRKTRGGHKAYVTQILPKAKELVATGHCTPETRPRFTKLKASLEEQLTSLRQLDEEILNGLVSVEGVTDEEIAEEVRTAGDLKGEISATITCLDDLLRPKSSGGHHKEHIQSATVSESPQVSPATSQPNIRVRLPKLEAKRFNGKIEEWQEFWDCYESSIDSNTALSSVDKFTYLRSLLGGAAQKAIAGLALTMANYQVAIDLLKERFGKAIVIERAHINDLLNVSPVYYDKDTVGLRRLYDTLEVHHRGLKALNVESTTYEGIVVPAIIGKLPEGVRLQITRGKNHHKWKMEDLLRELLTELELKEEHCVATRNPNPRDKDKGGRTGIGLNSASALLAKTNDFCAYCKGGHAHQDCMNVKSVEERKHLLRFVGKVALQTAQAVVKGDSKSVRVRVLFDAGSHRSFITSRAAQSAGLPIKGKEWIEISTFGQQTKDCGMRAVYELDVSPLQGGERVKIEAYESPTIAEIRNQHIEIRKGDYPHLQGLWFSDVNRKNKVLGIDLLIGADYLWSFQRGRTIRGEADQPVAVETCLAWALSGPMKGVPDGSQISVSFIGQVMPRHNKELEEGVQKLWDLETLGIREENEVHEALKDGISFNGDFKRLKGQIERLKNDPDVLKAYDAVIKEQAALGIFERVPELETPEKIDYLPHHPVIWKEAKTTKLRVVNDTSSKEGKKGVSLNDCLHVGPALSPLLYEILIRFRERPIALVCDIEKAFLNIEISLRDRDCLRFLWVNNVDSEHVDPVVYRFCRVVFGVNCSPFLLNATLQYHLDTFIEVDPEFVRMMKRSFYVDDLVSGEKTTQDAIQLHDKAQTRLALGGFKLTKWLTNSQELRTKIAQCELRDEPNVNKQIANADESYAKEMLGVKVGTRCEKVLGLSWNCDQDLFVFELTELVKRADGLPVTKRSILKVVAGLYDPLGVTGPVVVSVRVLFQELCANKVDWDDELKDEERKRWIGWLDDLRTAKEISVPRCVYHMCQCPVNCSLHGFADASIKAYCAVVYFVCEAYGAVHVTLLTSKTRVEIDNS